MRERANVIVRPSSSAAGAERESRSGAEWWSGGRQRRAIIIIGIIIWFMLPPSIIIMSIIGIWQEAEGCGRGQRGPASLGGAAKMRRRQMASGAP